jgi:hypothetical protein
MWLLATLLQLSHHLVTCAKYALSVTITTQDATIACRFALLCICMCVYIYIYIYMVTCSLCLHILAHKNVEYHTACEHRVQHLYLLYGYVMAVDLPCRLQDMLRYVSA